MRTDQYVTEALTDVEARRAELEEQLARNHGRAVFPALFDLTGRLVPARLVTTFYGSQWLILASEDPRGRVLARFTPSQARSRRVALRHDAAKGYYVGTVSTHARVEVVGAMPQQRVAIVRADYGFSGDVEILDCGIERR